MGISLGNTEGGEDEVVSAINTTPLVDVMLVLLIIFLITIPVVTQSAPVELPKETNRPRITNPENINISVTRDGTVYWNEQRIDGKEALLVRLKTAAVAVPQPEVQIRGDSHARYEHVGRVIFTCQRAGIRKIGFITEPPARG
ncbi:biopolymer transporter ExbD [Herbaspirillum sp. HC18]|nr:biopolymer transporter ExbD [Herbaspirillum sp. HC18]